MYAQRILVIDDEPQIRRVVRNVLEHDVERVLEASSGKEGDAATGHDFPTPQGLEEWLKFLATQCPE